MSVTNVWFSASEIARLRLPGFPATKRGVNDFAAREGWTGDIGKCRMRNGRGGGIEYRIDLLPPETLALHAAKTIGAIGAAAGQVVANDSPDGAPAPPAAAEGRDARMALVAAATKFARDGRLSWATALPAFAELYNARRIETADWIRDNIPQLSSRSLRRWRAILRKRGSGALAVDRGAARRGKGVLEAAEEGRVKLFCLALMARQPHLSAQHIRAMVADEFPELTPPSIRTFQLRLATWKRTHRVALTHITNPDVYKSCYRAAARGGSNQATRLNELWMIDSSPADVLCVDGRHSLYLAIDVFSRRVTIAITRTPRAAAVGLLMRRAILAWGVPERVKTDNGSDFRAKTTQRLFASLGIEVETAAPFSPEQKGHVERAIGTLQRDLMPLMPGYIGHCVADRKVIEARKAFARRIGDTDERAFCVELNARELQDYCDRWAADRYARRPHEGLKGRTPFDVAAADGGALRMIADVHALDMLLAPVAGKNGLRTVTKSGVRIEHAHYLTPSILPGQEVLVRMDAADMGRAFLFTPDGSAYLGEAVCPELAGVDPAAAIAQARAEQKRILDDGAADIRKRMRAIKPRDMADKVLRQSAREAGTLAALPKRNEIYATPALEAAREAARPRAGKTDIENVGDTAVAMLARVEAGLSGARSHASAANVAPLRTAATEQQRFRYALDLQRALARNDEISNADAIWLGAYVRGAEYKSQKTLFDDFGESALS